MSRFFKFTATLVSSFLFSITIFSQEVPSPYQWNVSAKKVADKIYELSFSVNGANGWQLYAPNQSLSGTRSVALNFNDATIHQADSFLQTGKIRSFVSPDFDNSTVKVYEGAAEWKITVSFDNAVPANLSGKIVYYYGKSDEFNPGEYSFTVALEGGVAAESIKRPSIDINNPINNCGDEGTQNKSLLTIFLLGLLGGLIALLTPCVFPMIPVTVTFFIKRSQNDKRGISNAILYGFFIFLIYVLITLPFHIANKAINPEIFNNISTNAGLNLLFFAVFVVFALSFFGLYEIGLPSAFANKMDARSGLGNFAGIFFMAITLAIVSFSCTGPILGTLLVGVADQGAWPLTVGAAGFGLALGLPFALFAMFPHWLHSLPKSGGWMTDLKVVLGFLELALAIKFLSNADLVKQWGLVKREIFIGAWVLIGLLTVLYLLGKIKISHSSPVKRFSFIRIAFIVLFAAITIYLLPGLTNTKWADRKMISGFPPPRTYSLYKIEKRESKIFEPLRNDYKKALELAKMEGKPVLIDFTGWACVNCRRMEDKVWTDRLVDSLMRNKFVVVSLYVDEKTRLPLVEQTVEKLSNGTERSIVKVGDKWATFQVENFGATSQPQYAIISPDEKALTKTKYYTPDADKFADWLQCGLDAFERSRK